MKSADIIEQSVAPLYRGLRRLKNKWLNRVDTPLIVLAYHRVTQLTNDPHQLAVSPAHFAAQMNYLRDNFRCLRFEEDWSALREPAIALTFDDGYADNLYEALPILEAIGVPATFFISTGNLDGRSDFWSDELAHLVLHAGGQTSDFILQDREYGGQWPTGHAHERESLHNRLHGHMLRIKAGRREEWLEQLRRWHGPERASQHDDRALTRQELQQLAASSLVTIGAHGVTHTPLAILSAEEQRQELVASKEELQGLIGQEVTVFSYPFGGQGQFNRTSQRLCRQTGFQRAVTTLPGQVHRWTDPWRLPRQLVRNWDVTTFAARLESFRA